MKIIHTTSGYSLIEVLVAVALLMFAIVGPMTIAVKSSQSSQYARQQTTAFFLAQEGISIVNTIRNNEALAWANDSRVDAWRWLDDPDLAPCFENYGCNIDFTGASFLSTVTSCEEPEDCQMQFSETRGRLVYQMRAGDLTPYRRIITLTKLGIEEEEIQVVSTIQWDTKLLGDSVQTVSQSTSLFHIYK